MRPQLLRHDSEELRQDLQQVHNPPQTQDIKDDSYLDNNNLPDEMDFLEICDEFDP